MNIRFIAGVAVLSLAASCGTAPSAGAPTPAPIPSRLPAPVAQAITRTSPGAQVAWITMLWPGTGAPPEYVGIDPTGRLAAKLDVAADARLRVRRSADGASILLIDDESVGLYSALDGKAQRAFSKAAFRDTADAFSPDARWLAILSGPSAALQMVDLASGASRVTPLGHDPNAALPGMGGRIPAGIVWGTVIFAPDSAHLYTIVDWGGPLRLTSFALDSGGWVQTGMMVDGQRGFRFPNCAGPALAARVLRDGPTLVVFCHVDGAVWFMDLATLSGSTVVQSDMKNPFWLSPIFTPDDHLLYLHQWPGFGDQYQVVDLRTRTLLGPKPTPTKVGDPGPFTLLGSVAYAGGTASTMPISPDGLRLYSGTSDGIVVLRVPDLKPLAKLAPGVSVDEVWVSGDGKTIYATADQGKRVVVMRDDGSDLRSVPLAAPNGSFIASERGAS